MCMRELHVILGKNLPTFSCIIRMLVCFWFEWSWLLRKRRRRMFSVWKSREKRLENPSTPKFLQNKICSSIVRLNLGSIHRCWFSLEKGEEESLLCSSSDIVIGSEANERKVKKSRNHGLAPIGPNMVLVQTCIWSSKKSIFSIVFCASVHSLPSNYDASSLTPFTLGLNSFLTPSVR